MTDFLLQGYSRVIATEIKHKIFTTWAFAGVFCFKTHFFYKSSLSLSYSLTSSFSRCLFACRVSVLSFSMARICDSVLDWMLTFYRAVCALMYLVNQYLLSAYCVFGRAWSPSKTLVRKSQNCPRAPFVHRGCRAVKQGIMIPIMWKMGKCRDGDVLRDVGEASSVCSQERLMGAFETNPQEHTRRPLQN